MEEKRILSSKTKQQKKISTIKEKQQEKKKKKIQTDIELLKLLFQKENDLYLRQKEITGKLKITNINYHKKKILEKLEAEESYKEQILTEYPTLLEDIKQKNKETIKNMQLTPYLTPIIHQIDSKKIKNHPKTIQDQEKLTTRQKNIKAHLQQGLQKLEELDNQAFLQTCNSKQKIMLALHLELLEQIPFKNEELADMFQENVESVNTLIENFEKTTSTTNNKTYKKE